MITDKEKRDIDQALDEVEEAIRRHNQWLEEQINKSHARLSKLTCDASDHTNIPPDSEKPLSGHSGTK